jgi:hypothetical protein
MTISALVLRLRRTSNEAIVLSERYFEYGEIPVLDDRLIRGSQAP